MDRQLFLKVVFDKGDAVELGRKPTRPVELGQGLIFPTIKDGRIRPV